MKNGKIAVMGWAGNPEQAAIMINQYTACEYIGTPRAFVNGYDIVILFGCNFINILKLLTCNGVKIVRVCGSDWYLPRYGKIIKKITWYIMKYTRLNIMYASELLANDVGLDGAILPMPINDDKFYDMGLTRDIDICYLRRKGRDNVYFPKALIDSNTLNKLEKGEGVFFIDGSIPYEEMPLIYNRSKKYVRFTTHDANPKMPCEAFLCGCEVWVNGKKMEAVPDYMLRDKEIPKWIDYLRDILH